MQKERSRRVCKLEKGVIPLNLVSKQTMHSTIYILAGLFCGHELDSNEFLSKSRRARSSISSFRRVLPRMYIDMQALNRPVMQRSQAQMTSQR
jgi:hypothetical protein